LSLKAIHIFLISISILLAFGFGAWAIFVQGGALYLFLGLLSIVVGILLIIYLIKFVQKLKNVSLL
jgi:hypothetical protein